MNKFEVGVIEVVCGGAHHVHALNPLSSLPVAGIEGLNLSGARIAAKALHAVNALIHRGQPASFFTAVARGASR